MAPGFSEFERAGLRVRNPLRSSKNFTFYSVLCFSPKFLVAIAIPRFARGFGNLAVQLISRKEIAQLEAGRIVGIGAVNGVVLNAGCPLLADCSSLGIG